MQPLQKSDIADLRDALFADCALDVTIKRNGTVVAQLAGVVAKMKFEDADKSAGRAFTNFVDFLFYGDSGYAPQTGDLLALDDSREYIVKPVSNDTWKWDDPYDLIKRVHAQRRTI